MCSTRHHAASCLKTRAAFVFGEARGHARHGGSQKVYQLLRRVLREFVFRSDTSQKPAPPHGLHAELVSGVRLDSVFGSGKRGASTRGLVKLGDVSVTVLAVSGVSCGTGRGRFEFRRQQHPSGANLWCVFEIGSVAVDASPVLKLNRHVLIITASPSQGSLSASFALLRGTVGPRRRIGGVNARGEVMMIIFSEQR